MEWFSMSTSYLRGIIRDPRRILIFIFFSTLFWAFSGMAFFREVILPRFYLSSDGHLAGDPSYYHELASKAAFIMRQQSLSFFQIHLQGQGPAGIASIAYLIWDSPYAVVLINAFLHALSCCILFMILNLWFSCKISVIAIIPFFISPGMMFWFSQINKDSFAVAGSFLYILGLLWLYFPSGTRSQTKTDLLSTFLMVFGSLLIWFVRPYLNGIFILVAILFLIFSFARRYRSERGRDLLRLVPIGLIVLGWTSVLTKGAASDQTIDSFFSLNGKSTIPRSGAIFSRCLYNVHNWQPLTLLPQSINQSVRTLMGQRCLIFYSLESQTNLNSLNSIYDVDTLPSGTLEALGYFPRAAILGSLAPWPNRWLYVFEKNQSFFYTITPIEAAGVYLGIFCTLWWILVSKMWGILSILGTSFTFMSVYGFCTPFLGALYRYRYTWWMLLLSVGLASGLSLLSRVWATTGTSVHPKST